MISNRLEQKYTDQELKKIGFTTDFINARSEYHDALIHQNKNLNYDELVNLLTVKGLPISKYDAVCQLAGVNRSIKNFFDWIGFPAFFTGSVLSILHAAEWITLPYVAIFIPAMLVMTAMVAAYVLIPFVKVTNFLPKKMEISPFTSSYTKAMVNYQRRLKAGRIQANNNREQGIKVLRDTIIECNKTHADFCVLNGHSTLLSALELTKDAKNDDEDDEDAILGAADALLESFSDATPNFFQRYINNYHFLPLMGGAFGLAGLVISTNPLLFLISGSTFSWGLSKSFTSYVLHVRASLHKGEGFLRSYVGGIGSFLSDGVAVDASPNNGASVKRGYLNEHLSLTQNTSLIFSILAVLLGYGLMSNYGALFVANYGFELVWSAIALFNVGSDLKIHNTLGALASAPFQWGNSAKKSAQFASHMIDKPAIIAVYEDAPEHLAPTPGAH